MVARCECFAEGDTEDNSRLARASAIVLLCMAGLIAIAVLIVAEVEAWTSGFCLGGGLFRSLFIKCRSRIV